MLINVANDEAVLELKLSGKPTLVVDGIAERDDVVAGWRCGGLRVHRHRAEDEQDRGNEGDGATQEHGESPE